ncbi:hypothetical protein C8R44DRAFT_201530 [Mycena epipterygia]|nr:hypothetical protein C8R44DRAFT_201530 [Mycena epipterygia]
MSKCNCHVCWSDLSVDEFRRLGCGHCFCTTCIDKIQRTVQRAVCPECRAPIAVGDPQVIYLDIVASKPLESVVADGISRMDQNSKLVSVRTAARKLKQVADQAQKDARALESLLAAIEDFNQRIIPIFAKVKSQQNEIVTLRSQLTGLDEVVAQAEKATALSGEVAILRADQVQLKRELRRVNEERDTAMELAEKGKKQVLELRGSAQAADADAQAEIRRLKGYLERNAEDRTAQKMKIQGLQQEKESLEQQVEELRNEIQEIRGSASSYYDEDIEIEDEVFPSESESQSSPYQASSQSTRRPHTHARQAQDLPVHDFEGMPRPGFGSDWQLGRGTKRREPETPRAFPIALSHGRTTIAVQLGPKHTRRVKARY